MLDHETKSWIAGIFNSSQKRDLNITDIHNRCQEIMQSEIPDSTQVELLYELAQASSDAAFYLMQLISQNEISKSAPLEFSEGSYFALNSLFPFILADKFIVIHDSFAYQNAKVEVVERPHAFRLFKWGRIIKDSAVDRLFSFPVADSIKTKNRLLILRAAIVAGLMKKAYELAYTFAYERAQGGRLIKDWSLIQSSLSDLYLHTKVNEKLISSMTMDSALAILKSCDQLSGQAMQIMGGAGYTEDYILEKYFREMHFLKNWPDRFLENQHSYYKNQVMSL